MWPYIIIGVIVLLIVLYILISYNGFVKLNNMVKEAFATMDVYLKKRWDLIPNILETVKEYTKYEEETLKNIVAVRNQPYDQLSYQEKMDGYNEISKGLVKVMALAEAYPELKANESFQTLTDNLTLIEDDIANARKYYNATIRDYNNKIMMFPSNIVAKMFGYKEKSSFEINEAERENVQVKF